MDDYPDELAFVQIHVGDDGYHTNWGGARANFYDLIYIPHTWFDGWVDYIGAVGYPVYRSAFLSRRNMPSTIGVDLGGEHISGETYRITARVFNEGTHPFTVRINMVQVLDYYPTVVNYSRNCFMQAASTVDVTLGAGECMTMVRQFTFQSWWNHDDIKIIAWAQQAYSSGPAFSYNAAQMAYPFGPLTPPQDYNSDGVVDLADYSSFSGCMSGPDPDSPPLAACREAFDADNDNDIDLADFMGFLEAMQAPSCG